MSKPNYIAYIRHLWVIDGNANCGKNVPAFRGAVHLNPHQADWL